jgi:hypothetical protein
MYTAVHERDSGMVKHAAARCLRYFFEQVAKSWGVELGSKYS